MGKSLLILCLCLLPMGCQVTDQTKITPLIRKELGETAINILNGADSIETIRIEGDPRKNRGLPDNQKLEGYEILSKGKPQGKKHIERLNQLLFNESSYSFDSAKGCIFMPGVAYRVSTEKATVVVLVCFSCDEIKILTYDAKGKQTHRFSEDIDNVRPQFVKLAKEAFPKDKAIQSLKAKE